MFQGFGTGVPSSVARQMHSGGKLVSHGRDPPSMRRASLCLLG
jgi:hypothetical protein